MALAALVAGAATARAEPPADEATAVAAAVLAHADWRALAERCPASLMPARQSSGELTTNDCGPGQRRACLAQCTAGEPQACYWLAYEIQQSRVDAAAADTLYQRSCQLGVVSGCTNRAARMSYDREDDPAAQACAAQTFSKACAADDPWGCAMHALHLSRGLGVKQDKAQALRALEKSCKHGPADEACQYGMEMKKSLLAEPAAREPRKP
jgi:hypothetical protein